MVFPPGHDDRRPWTSRGVVWWYQCASKRECERRWSRLFFGSGDRQAGRQSGSLATTNPNGAAFMCNPSEWSGIHVYSVPMAHPSLALQVNGPPFTCISSQWPTLHLLSVPMAHHSLALRPNGPALGRERERREGERGKRVSGCRGDEIARGHTHAHTPTKESETSENCPRRRRL